MPRGLRSAISNRPGARRLPEKPVEKSFMANERNACDHSLAIGYGFRLGFIKLIAHGTPAAIPLGAAPDGVANLPQSRCVSAAIPHPVAATGNLLRQASRFGMDGRSESEGGNIRCACLPGF